MVLIGLGQFIPSSYNNYGVDYDSDGIVDMYNSKKDGIASVANYLKENGWKSGNNVVSEVSVGEKYEKLQDQAISELELPFNLNNFKTRITANELLNEAFEFEGKFNEKSLKKYFLPGVILKIKLKLEFLSNSTKEFSIFTLKYPLFLK